MKKFIFMSLFALSTYSHAAPVNKAEVEKIIYPEILTPLNNLLNSNKITVYKGGINYAGETFDLNGCAFNYGYHMFFRGLLNTFADCNDMQDMARLCQQSVFQDLKRWVNTSKDENISDKAWQLASYYVVYSDISVEISTINFGLWADRAYQIQKKMNDDEKLEPLYDKYSRIKRDVQILNDEITKEQKKYFKKDELIKKLKSQKNQLEYEMQEIGNKIRIEKQKAP